MKSAVLIAIAAVSWLCPAALRADSPRELSLKWSELGPAVTDRKVSIGLPDGTYVEGKVQSVEPEGLRMRVTKTSNKTALAKGERLLPKQSVSTISVRHDRKIGRIIGVAAAVGGAVIAIAANDPRVDEGVGLIVIPAVAVGGTAGLGVAGYYIGRHFDKRTILIHVVRD